MDMASAATEITSLNSKSRKERMKLNEGQARSNIKSLVCALVASVLTTLSALQFRLYDWLSPVEVFLIGQVATVCFNLPPWIHNSRFHKETLKMLQDKKTYFHFGFHSVIIVAVAFLNYQSLKLLSSSVVFIIGSLGPFFSLILSRIIFKENITLIKLIALLVTILSVVMTSLIGKSLSISGSSSQFITGLALCIGTSFVGAITTISYKNISTWNVNLVCLVQALFGSMVCVVVILISEDFVVPQCGVPGVVVLLCGVGAALSGALYFNAFKFGEAGKVATMLHGLNITFSMVWEIAFFGLNPHLLQYISAALAIIGTGLNGFDKYITYPKRLRKAL